MPTQYQFWKLVGTSSDYPKMWFLIEYEDGLQVAINGSCMNIPNREKEYV